MRRLCLDTDFLVALLRKRPEVIKKAKECDFIKAQSCVQILSGRMFDHIDDR